MLKVPHLLTTTDSIASRTSDPASHARYRRQSLRSVILGLLVFLISGCSTITMSTYPSGPPPQIDVVFYGPTTPANYDMKISGGIFGSGGTLPVQRMAAYDSDPSRPPSTDPSYVAYGVSFTPVSGETYTADLGLYLSGMIYQSIGSITWSQGSQSSVCFGP